MCQTKDWNMYALRYFPEYCDPSLGFATGPSHPGPKNVFTGCMHTNDSRVFIFFEDIWYISCRDLLRTLGYFKGLTYEETREMINLLLDEYEISLL